MTKQYATPTSAADARIRVEVLKSNKRDIEAQLGEQVKLRKGRRISSNQYKAWRDNALTALRAIEEELRWTQDWLKAHVLRAEAGMVAIDLADCESVVRGAFFALSRLTDLHEIAWTEEGVGDADVLSIMHTVRQYAHGHRGEKSVVPPKMKPGEEVGGGKRRVQRPRIGPERRG